MDSFYTPDTIYRIDASDGGAAFCGTGWLLLRANIVPHFGDWRGQRMDAWPHGDLSELASMAGQAVERYGMQVYIGNMRGGIDHLAAQPIRHHGLQLQALGMEQSGIPLGVLRVHDKQGGVAGFARMVSVKGIEINGREISTIYWTHTGGA